MDLLIDTDVFSYVYRDKGPAASYVKHLQNNALAISFITVGELYGWASKHNWSSKSIVAMEAYLKNYIVIPFDYEVARKYGEIKTALERQGAPVGTNDIWIAACARRHGIPLVTHNRKDFIHVPDLVIISESP